MISLAPPSFAFAAVTEPEDEFLKLFPHRFDFIFADHPAPNESPNWHTERRYPLSDRLIQQGRYLYGVRFGATTRYCMLDIDAGSAHHPQRDPLAIGRIVAALEPLNLVSPVCCTSSTSGGLHLYFPFQQEHRSWQVAIALTTLLENAGFRVLPGQLEVFPNPRSYGTGGAISLYSAHRLPIQAGSYLLNSDFQPVWSDRPTFTRRWQFAQSRNLFGQTELKRALRRVRSHQYRVSGKADRFLDDLNAEIEAGWTGLGQTNRLLGRIALRCYVFHHVLTGGEPLTGQALADEIAATARSLPGYEQWCRHQHEIEHRAAEWARCVENSRYFPYGAAVRKQEPIDLPSNQPAWNEQQMQSARERIRLAIADLLAKGTLPTGITARFQVLTTYGISGSSLYRHRDLWHPSYLWKSPPHPPNFNQAEQEDCAEGASSCHSPGSLLPSTGCNAALGQVSSDFDLPQTCAAGCNESAAPACSPAQPIALPSAAALVVQPLPETVRSLPWHDLSDVWVAVTVELRRLAWTAEQVRDRLMAHFQKPDPALLEDWQVVQWLIWLRQQAVPN